MSETPPPQYETLKVSSNSRPKAVGGALATVVERDGRIYIQAIGAGAVNQAVKAIAIARGYVAPKGFDLVVSISFVHLTVDGQERTGIKFLVETKS